MPKILTDKELGQIVYDACTKPEVIEDADSYEHFLEDLGILIADHFGGICGGRATNFTDDDLGGWTVSFRVNECVPSDGGMFKDYDTDVTWEDGEEK